MAIPKTQDQRSEIRDDRFSGAFSCSLVAMLGSDRKVPIRPMDVSKRGLGFVVKEQLRVGQLFWLHMGNERYRVEVAFCGTYLGIEGLFRCGLFLREAEGDLLARCLELGLLADEHTKNHLKRFSNG